jgi:hypothetical protein
MSGASAIKRERQGPNPLKFNPAVIPDPTSTVGMNLDQLRQHNRAMRPVAGAVLGEMCIDA